PASGVARRDARLAPVQARERELARVEQGLSAARVAEAGHQERQARLDREEEDDAQDEDRHDHVPAPAPHVPSAAGALARTNTSTRELPSGLKRSVIVRRLDSTISIVPCMAHLRIRSPAAAPSTARVIAFREKRSRTVVPSHARIRISLYDSTFTPPGSARSISEARRAAAIRIDVPPRISTRSRSSTLARSRARTATSARTTEAIASVTSIS